MREKKDYKASDKRSKTTERSSSTRKTGDDNKSFKKDFKRSEGSSYFDKKDEKKPSRFGDRDEKRTYSPRSESRDERKPSRFGDRDEKRAYSPRSESRDERKPSRFGDRDEKRAYSPRSESRDERKPSRFGDRDEKRTYSPRRESKDERKPSRFGDRDEKRTYSSRSESRDEKRTYSSRDEKRTYSPRSESKDEKRTYSSRDEKRAYAPRTTSKFDDREEKRNKRNEASKYLDEVETKVRKPRSYEIKDLGYEENSSSKLIEKNSLEDETRNTYIYGRHPVIEALKGSTPVNKVWISDGTRDTDQIVEHIIERNIPYKIVTKTKLSYLVGEDTNHQGVVAEVAGKEYTEFHDLIELTKQKEVFFIVLDKLEDPHNLGAIIRTADAAGVDAIIVPKHRAVGLTGIVTKSSAGAITRMKICRVPNLVQAIEELKKSNVWVVGVDMEGTEVYSNAKLTGAITLCMGGEGEGLTRLVKEHCDFVVKIPMNSASNSLNVSVATGILTFEIYKQREFK